jgi:TonB family protein
MPRRNLICIFLIVFGLIFSIAVANSRKIKAEDMHTGKAHIEYNGSFPSPDEFILVESMPEMVYEEVPEYPRLARYAGMEATVWIKSLINKEGEVEKAVISKPSGSKAGFDKAALEAGYKNKFTPAIKDGKPVAVWITYKVAFVLDKDKTELKAPIENEEYFPKPDEFIPVEQMPEMIYEKVPVYPELAKNAGMEATVWIKSLINKKGEVVKAFVFKSSGSEVGFDESALKAAYKCKFTPAIKNGKPVAVWITYCVEFSLSKGKTEEKDNDKEKEK